MTDVDQDLVTSVQNATGISQISFLVYEQPEFVDKASGVRSLSDILQIAITVLILHCLALWYLRAQEAVRKSQRGGAVCRFSFRTDC